jgi:hypothetical protein
MRRSGMHAVVLVILLPVVLMWLINTCLASPNATGGEVLYNGVVLPRRPTR